MNGLPEPYLRACSYRLLLTFNEQSLGREIFPTDDAVVIGWADKVDLLRRAAGYIREQEAKYLRAQLTSEPHPDWPDVVYKQVLELWDQIDKCLAEADKLLRIDLSTATPQVKVKRHSLAVQCLTSGRQHLRLFQESAVQTVVKHCEGWQAFQEKVLTLPYADIQFPEPPADPELTADGLWKAYTQDLLELGRVALLGPDRKRCEQSRLATFHWVLLRSLHPTEWRADVHRELRQRHSALLKQMAESALQEAVELRLEYLLAYHSDAAFREEAINTLSDTEGQIKRAAVEVRAYDAKFNEASEAFQRQYSLTTTPDTGSAS